MTREDIYQGINLTPLHLMTLTTRGIMNKLVLSTKMILHMILLMIVRPRNMNTGFYSKKTCHWIF